MEVRRVKVLVSRYAKMRYNYIKRMLSGYNIKIDNKKYDAILVFGGDGTFLKYAALYHDKPILAVKSTSAESKLLGSRGLTIEVTDADLPKVLHTISEQNFYIKEEPLLKLRYMNKEYITAGDFYIERGNIRSALRYKLRVSYHGKETEIWGISNGVIITTPLGSTGYYAYVDILNKKRPKRINGLGVAHILPTYVIERSGKTRRQGNVREVFPIESKITLTFDRGARQYLYGPTLPERGIAVENGKELTFKIASERLKLIALHAK